MKKNLIGTTAVVLAYGVGCYLYGACVSAWVHARKIRRQKAIIDVQSCLIKHCLLGEDLKDGFETDEEEES